uniref:Uncharacterized protein n=1 Tax=Arundo donax TaxID=35708 RepID=A0A0A8XR45_ARUDO
MKICRNTGHDDIYYHTKFQLKTRKYSRCYLDNQKSFGEGKWTVLKKIHSQAFKCRGATTH